MNIPATRTRLEIASPGLFRAITYTRTGQKHTYYVRPAQGRCVCPAWHFNGFCKHLDGARRATLCAAPKVEKKAEARRYYMNSGEWETARDHAAWCVGCCECWEGE